MRVIVGIFFKFANKLPELYSNIKLQYMRKFILSFVLGVFALAASAGETPVKPSCGGFVTNGFWNNWEISAGIGVGTALTNGTNYGRFGNRIGFEGNISALKWITPVTGFRVQFQGGRFLNTDLEKGKVKWPYVFAHADLTINLSNWIGGYRDDRAYYLVPFIGFGYMTSNFTEEMHTQYNANTRQDFAFTYGLLNKFRISPSVDFNIELKSLLVKSELCPTETSGSYLFGFSATAGFTYRFNKRGWERGVPGYTAEDIAAFQEAVAARNAELEDSQAENARLNRELAAAQAAAAQAAAASDKAKADAAAAAARELNPVATSVILYDINTSKLSPKEKTRLLLMAEVIKNGPKDKVYTLQGHADKQTGTAALNKRLSENRAKNVYDFLVANGVNPKQLTYEGLGDAENPYNIQKANRAVVIK